MTALDAFTIVALVVAFTSLNVWQYKVYARERQELLDRLLAVTKPEALIVSRPVGDADVSYVDERREAELSPSGDSYGS